LGCSRIDEVETGFGRHAGAALGGRFVEALVPRACCQAVGTTASTTHTIEVVLWDCVDLRAVAAVSSRPSLSSDMDAGRGHPGRVCFPDAKSILLKEDAPTGSVDRHGEVGKDSGAQEAGFARKKLPCMEASLHAADPVFGKIDNRVDICDRTT
jgi:hypothetical protein